MTLAKPSPRTANMFTQRRISDIGSAEGRYVELVPKRTIDIEPCPYFGGCRLETHRERALDAVWVGEIHGATIHAPTFAVTSGDTLWQLDRATELPFFSADYSDAFRPAEDGRYSFKNPIQVPVKRVERAILLASRVSYSYFHCAFESLPKFVLLEEMGIGPEVPVITNGRSQNSVKELLTSVIGGNRQEIPMLPEQRLLVDRLHVAANCANLPDDPSLGIDRVAVDPDMLGKIVRRLRKPARNRPRTPILYISRSDYARIHRTMGFQVRDVEFGPEIESIILAAGGKIIRPERLTMAQQRDEFSSADIVVMAAGSAVTSLMFCEPGTKVIILAQDRNVNPGLFLTFLKSLNIDVFFVFGPGVPEFATAPHWNFIIHPQLFRRALSAVANGTSVPDGMLPLK